jgi:hypothetical protein
MSYLQEKKLEDVFEANRLRAQQGNRFPACGGTETPFYTRTGKRLLYCWQPTTGDHAYIDLDCDMLLTEEEARAALALY